MKYRILIEKSGVILEVIESAQNEFPWSLLRARLENIIQADFLDSKINLEISCLDSGNSTSETSIM